MAVASAMNAETVLKWQGTSVAMIMQAAQRRGGRWSRAVSMQAHIKRGWRDRMEQLIVDARSIQAA